MAQHPREGTIEVGGVSIAYANWGTGEQTSSEPRPVVVLVHGAGAHTRWWSFTAPLLAEHCDVLALDLSGHGNSGHRQTYHLEGWADEVSAVASTQAPGRPALIVGHSLGAMVATAMLAREPAHHAGLVVVDSAIRRADAGRAGGRPPAKGDRPRRARRSVFGLSRTYSSREMAIERFTPVPRQPVANSWALRHIAEHSVLAHGDRWGWRFDPTIGTWTTDHPMEAYAGQLREPVGVIRGQRSEIMTPDALSTLRELTGQPVPALSLSDAHHHLMLDRPLALVTSIRVLWPLLTGRRPR